MPGRRQLRSATRADGYETWTVAEDQYAPLRELILRTVADLDDGSGVALTALTAAAEAELSALPQFPNGRLTNWIRFVKADLECEGVLVRVPRSSPQRVRLA
jgi:hypothetical protein